MLEETSLVLNVDQLIIISIRIKYEIKNILRSGTLRPQYTATLNGEEGLNLGFDPPPEMVEFKLYLGHQFNPTFPKYV